MTFHSKASLGARHPLHNWEYADAAARTGATGFVAEDVGKVALQLDNNSLWSLQDTAPTWLELADPGSAPHSHTNKAELDLVTDGDHDVRTDNPHSTTKAQVGLGNVDDTQQIPLVEKGVANGVATLDAGAKIPAVQIPAIALPEVHVVADESARLGLTVQEGDEAIQLDDGSHWIWDGSSWIQRPHTLEAGPLTFVYQPGGTAQHNVYTDWATLVAAINLSSGIRYIQFDPSFGPILIPSGTWDMTDVRWIGETTSAMKTSITVAEGAVLTNLLHLEKVAVNFTGATPPIVLTTGMWMFLHASTIQASGSGPLVRCNTGGVLYLVMRNTGAILASVTPVIDLNASGAVVVVYGMENAVVPANCISGIAGTTYVPLFVDPAANLSLTQTGMAGTIFPVYMSKAANVEYNNGSSGLTAANVQDAIDEVESRFPDTPADDAIARYDGTGGTIQDSPLTISDAGVLSARDIATQFDENYDLGASDNRFEDAYIRRVFGHNTTDGTVTLTNAGALSMYVEGANQSRLSALMTGHGGTIVGNLGATGGAVGTGIVRSSGYGSFAGGMCWLEGSAAVNALIESTSYGSFAFGGLYAISGNATIRASGAGSWAGGYARGITASAALVRATAEAAFAFGSADSGQTVAATAKNSAQFFVGTNSLTNSFQIGDAGIRFKGTVGAPGGGSIQNGDFWVDATGNVFVRTNGVSKNLSNVT